MEKRVIRYYECDGGDNPKNHYPVNMKIISDGETFAVWGTGGCVYPRDYYVTLEDAKDVLKSKYDSVTQTGYKEEYYFKKNIKIK